MVAASSSLRAVTTLRPLQPVGGGGGRPQGLVDEAPPPAAAGLALGGAVPVGDALAGEGKAIQQPLEAALRMLFVDARPGVLGQRLVEPRQHHAAARRAGDGGQQVGGGRRRAGRPGGDDHLVRGPLPPRQAEAAQQHHPAGGDVDEAQILQAARPDLQGEVEEPRRRLPVAGQLALHQGLDRARVAGLLDLAGVEERRQRVGQFEGRPGVEAALQQVFVFRHQPRQLEPAAPGTDRRRQVERQVARFERRLALVEVAERADLRQQHGLRVTGVQKRLGQRPRRAAGRQQDHRVGQGRRIRRRQRADQPSGEILQERAVRGDREPARTGVVEEGGRTGCGNA